MNKYKADLHIHTCLSPCGDIDMSPGNIIGVAMQKNLDIIAITDHNTTRNVKVCMEIGEKHSIYVIPGCEVNTREEVHCLAYFPNIETTNKFQEYLDINLPDIKNNTRLFGYQLAVDENDVIIYEEKRLLFSSISKDIDEVAAFVHSLGGIFVPAHIDRGKNSLSSQLGFIPEDLEYDALEVSARTTNEVFAERFPNLKDKRILRNSDAHYQQDIARTYTTFYLEKLDWGNFKSAFHGLNNCYFKGEEW